MQFDRDGLILDACCVLTLYGSGVMRSILETMPVQVAVAETIHTEEALHVYEGPEEDVQQSKAKVNLDPLFNDGLVKSVTLTGEAEVASFIQLAQFLDDGEARTIAIAIHRGWMVATDDRKAIRIVEEVASGVSIVTTPELVKHWADNAHCSAQRLAAALDAIRMRASYVPPRGHPLASWWHQQAGS